MIIRRRGKQGAGAGGGGDDGAPSDVQHAGRVRLQRVLADAGVASRRDCEAMIESGRVSVNGDVSSRLPIFVNPKIDTIAIDGQELGGMQKRARRIYLMLNKPDNTLSTTRDGEANEGDTRRTVLDLVDHPAKARLFPVGRLEYHATGLVLLTNDGQMGQRLTHARFGVSKTYRVSVRGRLHEDAAESLRRRFCPAAVDQGLNASSDPVGAPLQSPTQRPTAQGWASVAPERAVSDRRKTGQRGLDRGGPVGARRAAVVEGATHQEPLLILKDSAVSTTFEIVMRPGSAKPARSEGREAMKAGAGGREPTRPPRAPAAAEDDGRARSVGEGTALANMMLRMGTPVRSIERVAIGPLRLKWCEPGSWRELSDDEIDLLRDAAGMPPSRDVRPGTMKTGDLGRGGRLRIVKPRSAAQRASELDSPRDVRPSGRPLSGTPKDLRSGGSKRAGGGAVSGFKSGSVGGPREQDRRGQGRTAAAPPRSRLAAGDVRRSDGPGEGVDRARPGVDRPSMDRPFTKRPTTNGPATARPASSNPRASKPGTGNPSTNSPSKGGPTYKKPGPKAQRKPAGPPKGRGPRDRRI